MLLTISPSTVDNWGTFIVSVLPFLTIFGLGWKALDKIFEYLGKRIKDVMLEVVKAYVTPIVDQLDNRFEGFKKEHAEIKKLLEDIKKKQ